LSSRRTVGAEAEARRFAKEESREMARLQGQLSGEEKRADAIDVKNIGDVRGQGRPCYKTQIF
jgi:hypothetical protein